MSPRRLATANRFPRLSTSFWVPVDSGSAPRSSYPSSSAALAITRVRGAILAFRGRSRVRSRFRVLLDLCGAIHGQVLVGHPLRRPAPQRLLADPAPIEELVGDPRR